jgi:dihydroneopterin triphosphate diphosphatase
MARVPFQILVMPFRRAPSGLYEFALMRRADGGYWQGVAGGGESGESPEQAAVREILEETGVFTDHPLYRLDTTCSVPTAGFPERRQWPPALHVMPEYAFALDCTGGEIRLSPEHTELVWLTYERAWPCLHWDSNRTALHELNERLLNGHMPPPAAV